MQSIFSAPSLLLAETPIALNFPPISLLPFFGCLAAGAGFGLPAGLAAGFVVGFSEGSLSSTSTYAVTAKSPFTPALHLSTLLRTSFASTSAIVTLSEGQLVGSRSPPGPHPNPL